MNFFYSGVDERFLYGCAAEFPKRNDCTAVRLYVILAYFCLEDVSYISGDYLKATLLAPKRSVVPAFVITFKFCGWMFVRSRKVHRYHDTLRLDLGPVRA